MLEMIKNLFMSPVFYLVLGLVAFFMWSMVSVFFRKINLRRNHVIVLAIIGLVISMGGTAWLGLGSVGTAGSVGSVAISSIQNTDEFFIKNSTFAPSNSDTNVKSVFYITETEAASDGAIIMNGTLMATRSGKLDAVSCPVVVSKPPRYDISDTTYHIVKEDSDTGVMEAYIYTGSSSGYADTSDPKESHQLAFADGVATGYVSYRVTIKETGFDALSQYDSKRISTNICGKPYVFEIVKSDA